ncbi:energy-coupled thiamine transporter ThiT [Tissierella creatinophila]|uniref:Thiamine transporter ThiT n=1 Tax=Tissierella creatinophila DSM 6911 TaxID=1123403 RepID=A0A1U7M649_TISCR|nr:energy-coupled thiamine transporter ThiT [Tissierella creatinophila]OLS02756.1 thiamine transporter ThiT [Tissierella creatinophila DSM 6911]
MKIEIILAIVLTLALFTISIIKLKDFKFTSKSLTRIAIMAAITILLYMIKLVPFPQGGGFSLLSVLPIMILSIVFGIPEGLLCAIIVASLQAILKPPLFPLQLPLDYFGVMMTIAFTPIFGTNKKTSIILGATLAGLLSTWFSVLSGVIFFSQFAPEGMNVWKYSIGYNFFGYGVEVLLSIIVLNVLPMKNLKQILQR